MFILVGLLFSAEVRVRNLTNYPFDRDSVSKSNVDNRTATLQRRVWVGLSLRPFTSNNIYFKMTQNLTCLSVLKLLLKKFCYHPT